MRRSSVIVGTLLVIASGMVPPSASAIPFAPDTFQDGTTMGWFVPGPSPNPPTNVANGGPAGVGDAFLQLVANGTGGPGVGGGRLVVLNEAQWTGDFLAAGITAIKMDVRNFGNTDLVLRLLFEHFEPPPFSPPVDLALTLADVTVPAGSGWMSVVFSLSPSNLAVETFGTVAGALSNVDVMRIFHNPDPTFPGPGAGIPLVVATLGVDNITAVPEPVTAILLAGGVAALLARRRRQ